MIAEPGHTARNKSARAGEAKGRILIVDDEPQTRRLLRKILVVRGYEVDDARRGDEAIDKIHDEKYDLVLLDIKMSQNEGIAVCREIRAISNVAIIMLTATDNEMNKIAALDAGADDCVARPFNAPELFARIRSVMRRNAMGSRIQRLSLKHMEIDFETRIVNVSGHEVHLTPKEFDLLRYLASHPNRVVPHRELLQAIWGPHYGLELEYLRVFIKQLRKKLELDPSKPRYLQTEPWVGYRLRIPE
jgi:two-component system KDP operon response regulator KdpE